MSDDVMEKGLRKAGWKPWAELTDKAKAEIRLIPAYKASTEKEMGEGLFRKDKRKGWEGLFVNLLAGTFGLN